MSATPFGPWLVAIALMPLAFGCGHVATRRVSFDPPGGAGGVAVFASCPPAGGRELGEVVARGGEGVEDNDVRELYSELIRQTKALGGDALVIESMKADLKSAPPAPSRVRELAPPCGARCTDETSLRGRAETMTVELRGKALRLSPEKPRGVTTGREP
jgi:hypothetical protein